VENFDRMSVSGAHYGSRATYPGFPAVAGTSGVGKTKDGRLVMFRGVRPPYGAYAGTTVARFAVPVPEDIDPVLAAAVSSPVLTSLLPLKYSTGLKPGETVWVNGATGFTGRLAVTVARMLGAARVVGTGRNAASLKKLREAGCDRLIDLSPGDETLAEAFREAAVSCPPDVIVDLLWGRPAGALIASLVPGDVKFPERAIRYLQLGEAAGARISLPAAALRTSGLVVQGAGPVSHQAVAREMPGLWEALRSGKFPADIERVRLSGLADAWQRATPGGTRLVVVP
jgi:NADPH2:quinone reductase